MCQPFQPPPSIEICRIYHYIAVLLPEHCFLLSKKLQIIYSHNETTSFTLQLPQNIRRTPCTIHCTPFVKSSLQSHRPPMCPGIFSPFYKERKKYLKCTFAVSRKTPIYFMCVREMLNLWKDLHFCRAHFPWHGLLVF